MKEKMFANFEPQTAEAWKSKLVEDLKGKPFEDEPKPEVAFY